MRHCTPAVPLLAVLLLDPVAPAVAGVIDTFETGGFGLSLSQPGNTTDSQSPLPGHCIASDRTVYAEYFPGTTGPFTCDLVPLDGQNDALEVTFPNGTGLFRLLYSGGPWDLTEGGTMNRITVSMGDADPGSVFLISLRDASTFSNETVTISGPGNYQFAFSDFSVDPTAVQEIGVSWYGFDGETCHLREITTTNGPAFSLLYRAWEPRTFMVSCAAAARAGGSEQVLGWNWAVDSPSLQELPGPVLEVTHLSAPGCVDVGFTATPAESDGLGSMGMVSVDWQSASFSSASFELQFATDPAAGYTAVMVGDPVHTFLGSAVVVSHDIAVSGIAGVPDGVVHQELIVSVHPDQGANLTFAEVQPAPGPGVGYVLQFVVAGGPYDPGSPLLEMFTLASYKDDAGTTAAPFAAATGRAAALVAVPSVTRSDVRFVLPASASGADVHIFDVAGRRVRTLQSTGSEARWDGTDAAGNRAPAGVYFGRSPAVGEAARVVLLR